MTLKTIRSHKTHTNKTSSDSYRKLLTAPAPRGRGEDKSPTRDSAKNRYLGIKNSICTLLKKFTNLILYI